MGTTSVARVRLLAVLAGGALGALVRAGMEEALPARPGGWPWATFSANIAGALLLAWLTTPARRVSGLESLPPAH